MDCVKPPSSDSTTRSKFSRAFAKCISNPQTPSRFAQNPTQKQLRTLSEELNININDHLKGTQHKLSRQKSYKPSHSGEQNGVKNRAVKEALLAKLFASLSSIKAAYAELQNAQFPYNNDAIQLADEALVSELMVLSELKHKYYHNGLDLPPPHVTHLLAEIQEQQSNIKTYEITMKQLEWKVQQKDNEIESLKTKLDEFTTHNKALEKRLNSSGVIASTTITPLGNNVPISSLNQSHFTRVLHFCLRSVRHFVKHLVREMESRGWDLDLAAKAIQTNTHFSKPCHKIFAFESYMTQIIFDGFNHPNYFIHEEVPSSTSKHHNYQSFQKLQKLTPTQIFNNYPKHPFASFTKSKYLKAVHPKMECSLFGNLDQRKGVTLGAFPSSEFFSLFAEMARRVWLLHCLAFSFDPPALAFQVRKGCRFSEVYMESVVISGEDDVISGEVVAAFTVVPGFKIGKLVVQSQVYLSPVVAASAPTRRRR